MRIIHLIARLNDGGPARVLVELATHAQSMGHEVRVLSGSVAADEPDFTPQLTAAGIRVEAVPGLARRIDPWAEIRAAQHLTRRLRCLRPDLLHTHTAKAGLMGRLIARHLALPCLHSYHGHVLSGHFHPLIAQAILAGERLAARYGHCHSLTPTLVQTLRDHFHLGRPPAWHCLPVPVRPVTPHSAPWHDQLDPHRPRIGFLGRLAPVKDGDLWLDCLAALQQQRPVQGVICGQGDQRRHLELRAAALGLRVHFAGHCATAEALAAMDVLLMTSRHEGQPLAAIEAAGAGVPVVAPAVGGLIDLGQQGLVEARPRQITDLTTAVQDLLDDPTRRQARIAAGRRAAAHCAPQRVCPRYLALYRRIAALLLIVGCALGLDLEPVGSDELMVGLAEWRLELTDDWRHLDVTRTPQLTITDPSGGQRTRSAFLYRPYRPTRSADGSGPEFTATGPEELRLRHRFDLPGDHSWQLSSPDNRPLASGVFQVAPAEPLRMIGISPHNPRLLATSDGRPFIPIGANIAWGVGANRIDHLRMHLLQLAINGGNHFRLWCASWSCQIEGQQPDDYRLDQAWMLDRVLSLARRQGLRVTLVLDNHHDLIHHRNAPYGDSLEERVETFFANPPPAAYVRRLRYLMARYGADPTIMAWELFNEIDEVIGEQGLALEDGEQRAYAWIQGAATALRQLDQDKRLIAASLARPRQWPRVLRAPALDLIDFHAYVPRFEHLAEPDKDGVGLLTSLGDLVADDPRPFRFSETGFHGSNDDNPGNAIDPQGLLLLHQAWAGFLLGGYGSAMNWWWDVYIDHHDLWPLYRPLADAVARIDWTDPDLRHRQLDNQAPWRTIGWQSPSQALLWPRHQADTWHAHLIEGLPRPQVAGVIVIDGFHPGINYRLRGHDLHTGHQRFNRTRSADRHGRLTIHLPSPSQDLALTITPSDR